MAGIGNLASQTAATGTLDASSLGPFDLVTLVKRDEIIRIKTQEFGREGFDSTMFYLAQVDGKEVRLVIDETRSPGEHTPW